MLPDGNGFDILGKLRGRPEFATLPIVLLTAKAELSDIRNGLALGADGYITKPYSKNQLAEVIGRVLKQEIGQIPARAALASIPSVRQSVVFGTMPSKDARFGVRTRLAGADGTARRPGTSSPRATIMRRNCTTARSLEPGWSCAAVGDRPHRLPHRHVLGRDALDAGEVAALHRLAVLQVAVVAALRFLRKSGSRSTPTVGARRTCAMPPA